MTTRRITLVISFVLLLALVAIPAAAQSYPDPGSGSTYTQLVNKTADSATVNVTYYNQAGTSQAGPSSSVAGNGSVNIDPGTSQLPQGYNGAGVVSSTKPLASTVNTRWEGSAVPDSFEMALYSGVAAGSSKICFPSLFKDPNIVSSFTVQNTGTGSADVSIEYYSRSGQSSSSAIVDSIPQGAQHTYDLRTPGAKVPSLPQGWDGSAIVTVTNGQSVAGVGVVNQQGRSATYNAADCAGLSGATTLVVPSQYRVFTGTDANNVSSYTLWSAINVQNLEGSTANVTLQYTPRDASKPSKTINAQVPANSAGGWNTRSSQFSDLNGSKDLGQDWDGTVTITSDRAIAATVITQWKRIGNESGYYAAANSATAKTKYWLPNVRRVNNGSDFPWYSAVLVQNIGTAPTTVTTKYYNTSGSLVHTFSESLAAGQGTGYNTRGGTGGTSALGNSFEGHAIVESDGQPIAAVLNLVARNDFGSATTNGIE